MPEYDAFGREIGEDPLANLREATNPALAKPEPVVAPTQPPPSEPAVALPGPVVAAPEPALPERVAPARVELVRPRRRRSGGLAALLVVVAVIGAVGLAANSAVEKGGDLIERISPPGAEPAPTGLQARSLVRQGNLADALKQLADSGLGRPTMIRIAPERVDATLLERGKIHIVQVNADGELRELGSNPGSDRAMAFKAIDPAAPERIVRRGANRKHPARSINYVLVTPGPPVAVNAYFEGRTVIGDAHGRPQRAF